MANNVYTLSINIQPFAEGLKGAVKLTEIASKQIRALLSNQIVKADSTQFNEEMKRVTAKVRQVSKMPLKIKPIVNTAPAIAGLTRLQGSAAKTQTSFQMLKTSVTGFGLAIIATTASIGIMTMMVGKIINPFVSFDYMMAKLQAISKATADEMERLKDVAMELGRTTRYTAAEVAGLQIEFAKLGFSAAEIEKVTAATLALATAADSTLPEAAMVAGNTLRGFQLDASETGRVTDVMAAAFTSSALDMSKWKESMKNIAPIAKAAGWSIEETATLLAKMADAGISGSRAGMALKNIMSQMFDEGSKLNDLFGNEIHTFDDFAKKMNELKDSNFDLAEATQYLDRRSKPAFLAMVSMAEGMEEYKITLDNASGSAQKMADIMKATMKGTGLEFKSAMEGLAIVFIEKLAPIMMLIVKSGTFLLGILTKLVKVLPIAVTALAAYGITNVIVNGGVIATTLSLIAQTGVIGGLISMWETLRITMLVNPYGLVIAGIAAVVAAFVIFRKSAKDVNDELERTPEIFENVTKSELTSALAEYNKEFGKDLDSYRGLVAEFNMVGDILADPTVPVQAGYLEMQSDKEKEALGRLIAMYKAYMTSSKKTQDEGNLETEKSLGEYYDLLKFEADNYYQFALQKIEDERVAREKGGLSAEKAEEIYNFKKEMLDKEYSAFKEERQKEVEAEQNKSDKIQAIIDSTAAKNISDQYDKKRTQLSIEEELQVKKLQTMKATESQILELRKQYSEQRKQVDSAEADHINNTALQNFDKAAQLAQRQRNLGLITYNQLRQVLVEYVAFAREKYGENSAEYISASEKMKQANTRFADSEADRFRSLGEIIMDSLGFSEEQQQAIVGSIGTITSQISNIFSLLYQNLSEEKNRAMTELEERAEREHWSDEKLAARKEKLQKEFAKKEKELNIKKQAMAVITSIINTAQAVTKALTAGPIIGPMLASMIAGLGLVEIKLIKSQKYAEGGKVEGGEKLVTVNEIGEEYILNHKATKAFGTPVLNFMNKFPEKAKVLMSNIPQINKISPPQFTFAIGGGTGNATTEIGKLKEEIKSMKDSVVTAIQAMNLNMVENDTQTPVNIIVETTDPEARIRKDTQVRDRLENYDGVMD